MIEEMVIRHCSPTLAGLKTANMFGYRYVAKELFISEIRELNNKLSSKGVYALPLTYDSQKALVYIYRPNMLKQDLENEDVRKILKDHGYKAESVPEFIAELSGRISGCETGFPHEVGCFLGYPPSDVRGFIDEHCPHRCKNCPKCRMVGCWKVYGDEQYAKKCFERYRKCSRVYWDVWVNSRNIEKLAVRDNTARISRAV